MPEGRFQLQISSFHLQKHLPVIRKGGCGLPHRTQALPWSLLRLLCGMCRVSSAIATCCVSNGVVYGVCCVCCSASLFVRLMVSTFRGMLFPSPSTWLLRTSTAIKQRVMNVTTVFSSLRLSSPSRVCARVLLPVPPSLFVRCGFVSAPGRATPGPPQSTRRGVSLHLCL